MTGARVAEASSEGEEIHRGELLGDAAAVGVLVRGLYVECGG